METVFLLGSAFFSFCRKFLLPVLICFIAFFSFDKAFGSELDFADRIKEFKLDNGMKVVIFKRDGLKQFAANIVYEVGSVDESNGYTGIAHILEHMLFKGTVLLGSSDWGKEKFYYDEMKRLGKKLDRAVLSNADESIVTSFKKRLNEIENRQRKYFSSEIYSTIYSAAGGVGFNAGTGKDYTTYFVRLPADKLELWAFIESQRMENIVFRDYYKEREVILEERKMRYENDPSGKLYESFLSTAYIAHPYKRPIIGWESDIKTMPLEKVDQFVKRWYVPNNGLIVLVGNIDIDRAENIIKKYFGKAKKIDIPERKYSKEPVNSGYREVTVDIDANPEIMIGFHKPSPPHEDDYVFDIIQEIVSGYSGARLNKALVIDSKDLSDIAVYTAPGVRYPNLFVISAYPKPGIDLQSVEDKILDELKKLAKEGITQEELKRAKSRIEGSFLISLKSHYNMARYLVYSVFRYSSAKALFSYIEKINQVTNDDIKKVSAKYFIRSNMTVARIKHNDKKK